MGGYDWLPCATCGELRGAFESHCTRCGSANACPNGHPADEPNQRLCNVCGIAIAASIAIAAAPGGREGRVSYLSNPWVLMIAAFLVVVLIGGGSAAALGAFGNGGGDSRQGGPDTIGSPPPAVAASPSPGASPQPQPSTSPAPTVEASPSAATPTEAPPATQAAGGSGGNTPIPAPSRTSTQAATTAPPPPAAIPTPTRTLAPASTPTRAPTATPTPSGPPARAIEAGDWNYDFTVTGNTCSFGPGRGETFPFVYELAEATPQDDFLADGERVVVSFVDQEDASRTELGTFVFRYPTFTFSYDIESATGEPGRATVVNTYTSTNAGTSTITEVYNPPSGQCQIRASE